MKIDLHVHSSERSGCGTAPDDEMILAAKARGLDALVFTDHDRLVPPERLLDLNRRHAPFRVFGGIEILVREDEHLLVYGLQDPALESRAWGYSDLHAFVKEHGGCIGLAHPFRFRDRLNIDVDACRPDVVEVRSANIPGESPPRQALVRRLGCPAIHGSDGHSTERVGLYYVTMNRAPGDDRELADMLRRGDFALDEEGAELFDLVDETGRRIGQATRRECHANPSLLHQAVHVLVFDGSGRLFLQKRSLRKDVQPGKWDTSVGGHVQPGEESRRAAARELKEELGIPVPRLEFLYAYTWRTDRESELVQTYRARADGPFRLHAGEIDEGRFWTMEEIEEHLGVGVFTPNFEHEFRRFQVSGFRKEKANGRRNADT
ncbi:MAG: NUDIX domain-containing protein [Kiritimatiellae bacterium]|nr:NUDIX domain-containing protein [Kiritimatiellia bacterium]